MSFHRANVKSGLMTAVVFGVAQASIFFIYGAGYSMGAFIVRSDPSEVYYADYDNIFRYAIIITSFMSYLLQSVCCCGVHCSQCGEGQFLCPRCPKGPAFSQSYPHSIGKGATNRWLLKGWTSSRKFHHPLCHRTCMRAIGLHHWIRCCEGRPV